MLNNKAVLALIGIILVLLVALAASQVGGIAIRSTGSSTDQLSLTISTPALRGVPVAVRWTTDVASSDVELIWRTREGETFVGRGSINAGTARVSFPCAGAATGTLLIREVTSGEILGSRVVELLEPTAECLP